MRKARWAGMLVLLFVLPFVEAQDNKYSIKTAETPIPQEIAAPIGKLLGHQSIQLVSPAGGTVCEVWFRKEIPADATAEQVKNGVTYREVPQSEIVGVV